MLQRYKKAVGIALEIPTHEFLGWGAFPLAHIQPFNNGRPMKSGQAVGLRHGPRLCGSLTLSSR